MTDPHRIDSLDALETLFDAPAPTSLEKEIDHISDHYRTFIEAAPFVVLATIGPKGIDCSSRGDPAGFVRIVDRKTLQLPDRRGNNRLDSLRNLVRDPRVSLLFLIPGIGETLRVKGRATLTTDPDLCASFAINDKRPKIVIEIAVEWVYFQCQKALVRSRLWDPAAQIPRSDLPSTGTMVAALTNNAVDGEAYDAAYPERLKKTIY